VGRNWRGLPTLEQAEDQINPKREFGDLTVDNFATAVSEQLSDQP